MRLQHSSNDTVRVAGAPGFVGDRDVLLRLLRDDAVGVAGPRGFVRNRNARGCLGSSGGDGDG